MRERNKWLEFAKEDLVVARLSLEKGIYNQVCFHSHQGVEKMLKGYLAAKDKDVPKTHFIGVLLRLCAQIDQRFKKMIDRCIKLDDYYIPTRYPDALPGRLPEGLPEKKDAEEALSVLEEIMDFVQKRQRQVKANEAVR